MIYFRKKKAYLTEQLMVVKYLESWSGGKSLHILAPHRPADVQFPNGYADMRVAPHEGISVKISG